MLNEILNKNKRFTFQPDFVFSSLLIAIKRFLDFVKIDCLIDGFILN